MLTHDAAEHGIIKYTRNVMLHMIPLDIRQYRFDVPEGKNERNEMHRQREFWCGVRMYHIPRGFLGDTGSKNTVCLFLDGNTQFTQWR